MSEKTTTEHPPLEGEALVQFAISSANPFLLLSKEMLEADGSRLDEEVEQNVIRAFLELGRGDLPGIHEMHRDLREALATKHQTLLRIDDALIEHLMRMLER